MTEASSEILPNAVYTLAEACQLLKIGEATARRWLKQGRLPHRRLGRGYRFLGRDLLEALGIPSNQPLLTEEEGIHYFSPSSPLLSLSGSSRSGKGDIAEKHDQYLASSLREEA